MSSYFFIHAEKNTSNAKLIDELESYAEANKQLIYVLNKPLTDQKYNYSYQNALIILSPRHKICIISCVEKDSNFSNYIEDVIEDIGTISDKYLYKDVIGRPRIWRQTLIESDKEILEIKNTSEFFNSIKVENLMDIKKLDLLISLFIGSINDIERVKEQIPQTTLDKVKQKIQLFDGDQTRFIYQNLDKSRVVIQGLSGTGKTELLLHKLKDLYISEPKSKIYFTCHNRILADHLKKRIPDFFNFMKVEQQIEWHKRLWCTHAWGSANDPNSGVYRYICAFYQIPFHRYSKQMSFSKACQLALQDIKEKFEQSSKIYAFSYMFIDESQDFDENFFELCDFITEKFIYIAGDIFQSIFDDNFSNHIKPDFLLGKCYRTDPKTLMFAHGLGMGLFESEKIRWLDKKEWEDCGYNVEIKNNHYHLNREPLRRFEDLDDRFESMEIVEIGENYSDTIVGIIKNIITENSTVLPEDIGIILLDQNSSIYELADVLEYKIQDELGWNVNKAYETKEKIGNSIFISNRNNVKGLEFPFVICVTRSISNNLSYRNSLYTMLTRSFIKSFLVLPNTSNSGLTNGMKKGLSTINKYKEMIIQEPSELEKSTIRTKFEYQIKQKSFYDKISEVFSILEIQSKYREKLTALAQQMDMADSESDTIIQFVKDNLKYLKD